jgi:hypothetical protein
MRAWLGAGLEKRFERWRDRYSDPLMTALTVLLLLLMFVIAPLQASGNLYVEGVGFIIGFTMIGGALIMSGSIPLLMIMLVALVMNGTAVLLRLRAPSLLDIYLIACAWLIIGSALAYVVGSGVFGPGRVNYHRIIGAIFLYFLIAMIFVTFYILIGLLLPDAFSGLKVEDSPALASNLIYFSFMTLTSTGYGDIVPVQPIARSLSNLESIIGQLYPATLLARLVTLELQDRR